jgi:hypothetical protein
MENFVTVFGDYNGLKIERNGGYIRISQILGENKIVVLSNDEAMRLADHVAVTTSSDQAITFDGTTLRIFSQNYLVSSLLSHILKEAVLKNVDLV